MPSLPEEIADIVTKQPGEMTIGDVERLRNVVAAWSDALAWISTHANTTKAAVARTQRVAAGALNRGKRPQEVLDGRPETESDGVPDTED